ncbi:MAG TPA: hypothetical protein DCR48_00295 [Flavobacteriales bacterium]|nr:hypothetical protein [Flavobacteriales bacterium]
MYRYFLSFISLLFYNFSVAQSIVNTEKLFINNDDGFAVSSELMGSSIQGNAEVLLVEYSLNFAYKKAKNSFKLLSGGEYINESRQVVSNSIFSQLRYNYNFSAKSRLFAFAQVQSNAILLLEHRLLGGAGFRQNIIEKKKDTTRVFKIDLSVGIMQEEELLNRTDLPVAEKYYTNYTRSVISIVGVYEVTDVFTIVNTTYLQKYIKDFSDYRLLNETNLMFSINEMLSVSLDLEYRFDSDPPSTLKDTDFNTNFGFVFSL